MKHSSNKGAIMKYKFHLDLYFSNRDMNGNVYSAMRIISNETGCSIMIDDAGKNGPHYLRNFFDDFGHWTYTDVWLGKREFNRLTKGAQIMKETDIHSWLAQNCTREVSQ